MRILVFQDSLVANQVLASMPHTAAKRVKTKYADDEAASLLLASAKSGKAKYGKSRQGDRAVAYSAMLE